MNASRPTKPEVVIPELFTAARWAELAERIGLTPRQREVAKLICRSFTNAHISAELRVSLGTVRLHVDALFKRLGVHSRVGTIVQLVLADRAMARVKVRGKVT
ncbi:MAG: helix-turn-helix transcriptional regulator [Planctomycetes bacterium]|nr:helix-turn-helix transcriptional regulator [Planctomycetota bacterium]MBI3833445.1 helix-turn-helix transcriptional regulator [Planctomycetota bacterium]